MQKTKKAMNIRLPHSAKPSRWLWPKIVSKWLTGVNLVHPRAAMSLPFLSRRDRHFPFLSLTPDANLTTQEF